MTLTELKAKWNARIDSYALDGVTTKNPSGISKEEAKFIALIQEFLTDAHDSIPHEHEHPPTDTGCNCTASGDWHDATKWASGKIPGPMDDWTIPTGVVMTVRADVIAGNGMVHGHLVFADVIQKFTVRSCVAMGEGAQITGMISKKLVIELNGNEIVTGMGARVLGAMGGGKIDLRGTVSAWSWTLLDKTAEAGATEIEMDSATGWSVGDEIIVTSTSDDPEETEKRAIVAISGYFITLDAPLSFTHNGQQTVDSHSKSDVPRIIDTCGEVALLTHPIRIQGPEDSEVTLFGAHCMIMDDASEGVFEGVEFYRCGQDGKLGRYPIHWHNVNEGGASSYISMCSVHRSYNRGMTIHKTNRLKLTDCVLFDTLGNGFFLEDGKEIRNVFTRCLGANVKKGSLDQQRDDGSTHPSVFWISNPNNDFIGCVAAGSGHNKVGGIGFDFDLPVNPRAGSISTDPNYFPYQQPAGVFRDNRVHSIRGAFGNSAAVWSGHGFQTPDFIMDGLTVFGISNPAATIYSNRGNIIHCNGAAIIADHVVVKGTVLMEDSLVMSNRGTALAAPSLMAFVYDGVPHFKNCVIRGFDALLFENNPISLGTWLENCEVSDSILSLKPPTDYTMAIPDPHDTFGNGAHGTFINQPYSYGTDSIPNPHGAGIESVRWSPHEFVSLAAEWFGAAKRVIIPINGELDIDTVGEPTSDARMSVVSCIGDFRDIFPPAPGKHIIISFSFAAAGFAGVAIGAEDYNNGRVTPPVASLDALRASPVNAWFREGPKIWLRGDYKPDLKFGFVYQ